MTARRYDADDFLEVYDLGEDSDFIDHWVVYIGNDCFTMCDNANLPNGVNMYAGATADCFRPMVEGPKVENLAELPEGTRIAIVRELQAQDRPIPESLFADPFTVPREPISLPISLPDFPGEKADAAISISIRQEDVETLARALCHASSEGGPEILRTYGNTMRAALPGEKSPYETAAARISATPQLEPYRETILYDWPEGEDHYTWAATCDLAELLDWAEAVTTDKA